MPIIDRLIHNPLNGVVDVMPPKFEIYRDGNGEHRFQLKAGNGEVIAVSEGYSSRDACLNGVASVQRNAPIAEIVDAN